MRSPASREQLLVRRPVEATPLHRSGLQPARFHALRIVVAAEIPDEHAIGSKPRRNQNEELRVVLPRVRWEIA